MNETIIKVSKPGRFLLVMLCVVLAIGVASCKKDVAATKPDDVDYYTCTMHPSVKSEDPKAKCPICGMDLVPVMKKGAAGTNTTIARTPVTVSSDEKPVEFIVPVERQQQIGVTYAAIEKRPFTFSVRVAGMVAYDKQRHWDYVARVDGYVKELFVFSRGELVEKDAPLLTIYSPDLLTTQNEFVDLLKTQDEARDNGSPAMLQSTERLVESAKQRLRLWNITDDQIVELEKT